MKEINQSYEERDLKLLLSCARHRDRGFIYLSKSDFGLAFSSILIRSKDIYAFSEKLNPELFKNTLFMNNLNEFLYSFHNLNWLISEEDNNYLLLKKRWDEKIFFNFKLRLAEQDLTRRLNSYFGREISDLVIVPKGQTLFKEKDENSGRVVVIHNDQTEKSKSLINFFQKEVFR